MGAEAGVRKARQQLQGFLLRHDRIYTGRSHWTKAHGQWLAGIRFDHPGKNAIN